MSASSHPASFRDPSGFVFERDGELLRQVNAGYVKHFRQLMDSGLYDALVRRGWLVEHQSVATAPDGAVTIKPARIPYVSYPYEWCFSQYQAAALLTLDIQTLALEHGMSLKDASAYNVQFVGNRPVFIDTLSFEAFDPGKPWVAYGQFCRHFLGPLALMSRVDSRARQLMLANIDGVPLDLVSAMLPKRSWLSYSQLMHLHVHARSAARGPGGSASATQMNERVHAGLVASLRAAVVGCRLTERKTQWGDYYAETNYADEAMAAKAALVRELLSAHAPAGATVHDLGANTGRFSRIAAELGHYVVSHDVDELAVERNYRDLEGDERSDRVLPLVTNLTSPSPALGWDLTERDSLLARTGTDVALALALVHHLAIGNNVPLDRVAAFFARMASLLVVEFVPKADSQVQRMLSTREDIFPHYTEDGFEAAFSAVYRLAEKRRIPGTERTLYAGVRIEG